MNENEEIKRIINLNVEVFKSIKTIKIKEYLEKINLLQEIINKETNEEEKNKFEESLKLLQSYINKNEEISDELLTNILSENSIYLYGISNENLNLLYHETIDAYLTSNLRKLNIIYEESKKIKDKTYIPSLVYSKVLLKNIDATSFFDAKGINYLKHKLNNM